MKTITGQFLRPDGSPAAGAILELLLSQDAIATSPMETILHSEVDITLDQNGNIPPGAQIWCNDEILPSGTYYTIRVIDGTFGRVFFERLPITGASPVNINSLVPPLIPS